MKKRLNEGVNDLLNDFTLSDEQLLSFAQLEKDCLQEGQYPNNKYKTKKWFSLVASFLIAALVFTGLIYKEADTNQVLYEIAAEVSYNHLNLKPLEVASNNFLQVTGYFKRLDFNPLISSQVSALAGDLIGGRYCSIKGNIAAQLRMQDKLGRMSTLFESRYNKDDFKMLPVLEKGESPVSLHVDGQQVSMWIEKGVVMALVRDLSGDDI